MTDRFKVVTELPEGEECVSMIEFKGKIYLATRQRVYVLEEDRRVPLQFGLSEK